MWGPASVFGAILVVTGPTVILPLLRHARLERRSAAFLKWEAIINDPVGAILTAVVIEILVGVPPPAGEDPATALTLHLAEGVLVAGALGVGSALLVAWAFRRDLIPETLKTPVLLALALVAYVVPNLLMHEAGLIGATVFGIALANRHVPGLAELRRFKESARRPAGVMPVRRADRRPRPRGPRQAVRAHLRADGSDPVRGPPGGDLVGHAAQRPILAGAPVRRLDRPPRHRRGRRRGAGRPPPQRGGLCRRRPDPAHRVRGHRRDRARPRLLPRTARPSLRPVDCRRYPAARRRRGIPVGERSRHRAAPGGRAGRDHRHLPRCPVCGAEGGRADAAGRTPVPTRRGRDWPTILRTTCSPRPGTISTTPSCVRGWPRRSVASASTSSPRPRTTCCTRIPVSAGMPAERCSATLTPTSMRWLGGMRPDGGSGYSLRYRRSDGRHTSAHHQGRWQSRFVSVDHEPNEIAAGDRFLVLQAARTATVEPDDRMISVPA